MYGPYGASFYNGLQAKLEKRLSAGVTFLISYSYAKALDDSDSIQLSTNGGGVQQLVDSLPDILAGQAFRGILDALKKARAEKRAILRS